MHTWMVKYKLFAESDLSFSLSLSLSLSESFLCGSFIFVGEVNVGTPKNYELSHTYCSIPFKTEAIKKEKNQTSVTLGVIFSLTVKLYAHMFIIFFYF